MTRPFTTLALRACNDGLAHPTQREAWGRAKRQVEALAAAWERNEADRGGVRELIARQIEYCQLAGVPLRWSDERSSW